MAAGKLVKKIVERVVKTPTSKLKTKKAEMGPRDIAKTGKGSGQKRFTGASKDEQDIAQKKGSAARMMPSNAPKNKFVIDRVKTLLKKFKANNGLSESDKISLRGNVSDNVKLIKENFNANDRDLIAKIIVRKKGGPIVKKPMGGKVYKNTVARKHGGAIGTGAALRGFGKGYKKG